MANPLRKSRSSNRREPTIALINIVFLMLVFFLIAGTITAPLSPDLKLVNTAELEGAEPPDALVLSSEGTLSFRGDTISPAEFMAQLGDDARAIVRLVPDRAAPAADLVRIGAELRNAGAVSVRIVTERALQ